MRLVGNSYLNIAINYNTLASQARVDLRADGAVNKVLFLVGYFLYVVHTLVYINVAGAAAAYPAAVVLQVNTVLQAYIQYRLAFGYGQFNRLVVFLGKVYFNVINVHLVQK